ncbi:hypothetical protein FRC09_014582 [Ceratobasidium sp. 395]|nr:hypothetical protein FRC09_014582 [Ceratobasidium sp. 395]
MSKRRSIHGLKIATTGEGRNRMVHNPPISLNNPPSDPSPSRLPTILPANLLPPIRLLPPTVLSHTGAGTWTMFDFDELLEARQLMGEIENAVLAARQYWLGIQSKRFAHLSGEGVVPQLISPHHVNEQNLQCELWRLQYLFGEDVSKKREPSEVAAAEILSLQEKEEETVQRFITELEEMREKFSPGGQCWPIVEMATAIIAARESSPSLRPSSPELLAQPLLPEEHLNGKCLAQ